MGSIIELNAHIFGLNQSVIELESSLITEIISRKKYFRRMDNMEIFSNTKFVVETIEEKTIYCV